jgi:NAD dependent epimerase/dehydratase
MNWSNRRVLVTGAGGFIGSHLTEAIVGLGAKVRAFVRYNSRGDVGLLSLLPADKRVEVEIVAGDLRDQDAVVEACRGVSHVFHLGALIAIPYSYIHPREVVETNVIGTLNILMASRGQVERVVHTSSSEVYGTARQVPISEEHPLQGQSPYSASKIGADKVAESFFCSYDLPVATIRPFNTYGPRQSARAVIPTIITQALTQDQVRLGALSPRRDFTYVEDTVEGFLRIAESDKALGQVINVGSNHEITIRDLAETIIRLVGRDVQLVTDEQRLRPERSEVRRLLADNHRAAEWLDWRPRTSLDEGLSKTIDWVAQHLDRFRTDEYQV